MSKSSVYVIGPISGMTEVPLAEKIQRFHSAEAELTALGYRVVNPLNVKPDCDQSCNTDGHVGQDGVPTHSWECFMRHDLKELLTCDHVATLPGYKLSRGATLEIEIAMALKMKSLMLDSAGKVVNTAQLDTDTHSEDADK